MSVLFTITGKVTSGSQRGRSLGFPTANLNISAGDLAEGIYIASAYKEKRKIPALLFIGSALTFNEARRKVEVYLLDSGGDWYGEKIVVEALKKIRENIKFASAEELVKQMKRDELEARKYFESELKQE